MIAGDLQQTIITLIDRLKMQEERLIPVLMERGGITETYAREVIRGSIAQLETQLYHIRRVGYFTELGEQLKKETERLLREGEILLGAKSSVDWKWIVGIGLGILVLTGMGKSKKKPESEES